jgi:hypothetical protein
MEEEHVLMEIDTVGGAVPPAEPCLDDSSGTSCRSPSRGAGGARPPG